MPFDAETIMLELIIALREALEKLERRNSAQPTRRAALQAAPPIT